MRALAVLLGLMITEISAAPAQTPAALDQQVQSGICPSNLVTYKLLSYPEYCSAVSVTHSTECQNDVEWMNRVASRYNELVRKCRAKNQKRKAKKSRPPKPSKIAGRSPMTKKRQSPPTAVAHPEGDRRPISTPEKNKAAGCGKCKDECSFTIVDATAKLALEQCSGSDLRCETRIVRLLIKTGRYSGCLQRCKCNRMQDTQGGTLRLPMPAAASGPINQ
jgi:hypothetical protein